jgi:hypothetical protein
VTASFDSTARVWDDSRTATFLRERAVVLTAALAQGIGRVTEIERSDLLMREAPADLFVAAMELLRGRPGVLAETVAALQAPLHPNCYLSSTEFAEMFDLIPVKTKDRPWSWSLWLAFGALLLVFATRSCVW